MIIILNIDILSSNTKRGFLGEIFILSLLIIISCYLAKKNDDYVIEGSDI